MSFATPNIFNWVFYFYCLIFRDLRNTHARTLSSMSEQKGSKHRILFQTDSQTSSSTEGLFEIGKKNKKNRDVSFLTNGPKTWEDIESNLRTEMLAEEPEATTVDDDKSNDPVDNLWLSGGGRDRVLTKIIESYITRLKQMNRILKIDRPFDYCDDDTLCFKFLQWYARWCTAQFDDQRTKFRTERKVWKRAQVIRVQIEKAFASSLRAGDSKPHYIYRMLDKDINQDTDGPALLPGEINDPEAGKTRPGAGSIEPLHTRVCELGLTIQKGSLNWITGVAWWLAHRELEVSDEESEIEPEWTTILYRSSYKQWELRISPTKKMILALRPQVKPKLDVEVAMDLSVQETGSGETVAITPQQPSPMIIV